MRCVDSSAPPLLHVYLPPIHHDRSDSGDYLCTASNGVGHLQHATVSLTVLCKLELMMSRSVIVPLLPDPPGIRAVAQQVQAGGGSPALLACQVEGQPQPAVDWFRCDQCQEKVKNCSKLRWHMRVKHREILLQGGAAAGARQEQGQCGGEGWLNTTPA